MLTIYIIKCKDVLIDTIVIIYLFIFGCTPLVFNYNKQKQINNAYNE